MALALALAALLSLICALAASTRPVWRGPPQPRLRGRTIAFEREAANLR